jgi:pyruvate/2-oxoglutarate dehydrogenase complex dihydrolipoamide dehydrogenase (E3) component
LNFEIDFLFFYFFLKNHLTLLFSLAKEITLDLPSMMKQKDTAVNGLTSGIEHLFKANKVSSFVLFS